MYKELKSIYQNKIIEPQKGQYPLDYYYFFNENKKLFGIEKSITENEYSLLKTMYVEKEFHFNNKNDQQIFEFLFEDGKFPFSKKRGRFLLYRTPQLTEQEKINALLKDLFGEIYTLNYLDTQIIFYFDKFDTEIQQVFQALSDDFGIHLLVHDGIFIYEDTLGKDIITYLKAYYNSPSLNKQDYSNVADLILKVSSNYYFEITKIIRSNVLKNIITNNEFLEIIQTFFKNDLNVSKSAKNLYMHRNSLINKLDLISKEIGLNLQNFQSASAILVLLSKDFS